VSALEWTPDEEGGFEARLTIEGMCLVEMSVGLCDTADDNRVVVSWSVHSLGTYDCGDEDTAEAAKAAAEQYALELFERAVAAMKGSAE
jgi:hypothetical protein